jgi:hypothetical protein
MKPMSSAGAGVPWSTLAAERPELAEAGRALLYQFGVGLAFLGTIRKDGGPRVHPVCPLIAIGAIYMLVTASHKRQDLHRDPRYALHSYPCPTNEDAFYLAGEAVLVHDEDALRTVRAQFLAERGWSETPPPNWADQQVFELLIERCLHTTTTGHGDFQPVDTVWRPGL